MLSGNVFIGVAFVIGFVYSWQLSLLMLVIVPLVIIATFLQAHLLIRSSGQAGNEHGEKILYQTL